MAVDKLPYCISFVLSDVYRSTYGIGRGGQFGTRKAATSVFLSVLLTLRNFGLALVISMI